MAVAASSVNPVSRASVPAGSGSSSVDDTTIAPHRRPPTLTGTPTAARTPSSPATSQSGPEVPVEPSIRAGRPVSNTSVYTFRPPGLSRVPAGTAVSVLLHVATNLAAPSGSYWVIHAGWAPSSRPASSATAANTSAGVADRATSVATRRSAACS